jgi:hypothetical protein
MRYTQYALILVTAALLSFKLFAQQEMMDHSHMPIAVPDDTPTPALSLKLLKDSMSGYNLILDTQRYDLSVPPAGKMNMQQMMSATMNPSSGFLQGHAHLYINGVKIQRIYGPALHLPATLFKRGINTISVTLNNHGHMYWTAQGKKIVATLYINEETKELITYRFESFPSKVENTY